MYNVVISIYYPMQWKYSWLTFKAVCKWSIVTWLGNKYFKDILIARLVNESINSWDRMITVQINLSGQIITVCIN